MWTRSAESKFIVLEVTSIADARQKLDIYIGPGTPDRVRSLTIAGHAGSGVFVVGPQHPSADTLEDQESVDALLAGRKHKFRNATITLMGCNSKVAELGRHVKNATGCKGVFGAPCFVGISDGDFVDADTKQPIKPVRID